MKGDRGGIDFNWNMFRSSVVAVCCCLSCAVTAIAYSLLSYMNINHNNIRM